MDFLGGTAGGFGELWSNSDNYTRDSMKLYVNIRKIEIITRKILILRYERYYCLRGNKVGYNI